MMVEFRLFVADLKYFLKEILALCFARALVYFAKRWLFSNPPANSSNVRLIIFLTDLFEGLAFREPVAYFLRKLVGEFRWPSHYSHRVLTC